MLYLVIFAGMKRKSNVGSSLMSDTSSISSQWLNLILEKLKANKNRKSTLNNYHQIWKQLNEFVLKLDVRPANRERPVALFCAYLVDKGTKSTTIRSYISALKSILVTDGYKWDDSLIIVETIIKACKILNDKVFNRFPIRIGFLEMILFELQGMFSTDYYLAVLYKTILLVSYYGMLCISEIASFESNVSLDHLIKACNVHIGRNKPKMLLILYTSKTHGRELRPQQVKIQAVIEHC